MKKNKRKMNIGKEWDERGLYNYKQVMDKVLVFMKYGQ